MVRNSTQGPQSWWCNTDRISEKVHNVWEGADSISVILQLIVILFYLFVLFDHDCVIK